MSLSAVVKPKNQRAKRALEKRKPLIHELDKNALFVRGGQTSETVTKVLKELCSLKKPLATMMQKKNMTRPFDDGTSLEFFSKRSDSSLFMFGSDSKKRPNNIIMGRMFDYTILDMFEFGVEKFISLQEFKNQKIAAGTKPCLLFCGDAFDSTVENMRLRNFLIDFFRGANATQISLAGYSHALQFLLLGEKLLIRSYRIILKKSGLKTPQIELEEIGPSLDLKLRRVQIGSKDMYKTACRMPKAAKIKKHKNITKDAFGSKVAQIHMEPQDFTELITKKTKGFKRKLSQVDDKEKTDNKKSKMSEENTE